MTLACPECGLVNTMHDGPTPDARPKNGDVSLCWGCRALSIYADTPLGLTLRKPTDAEAEQLARDPAVMEALGLATESFHPNELAELRWGAERTCRVCGCTDDRACVNFFGDPCSWIAPDLCSECKLEGAAAGGGR